MPQGLQAPSTESQLCLFPLCRISYHLSACPSFHQDSTPAMPGCGENKMGVVRKCSLCMYWHIEGTSKEFPCDLSLYLCVQEPWDCRSVTTKAIKSKLSTMLAVDSGQIIASKKVGLLLRPQSFLQLLGPVTRPGHGLPGEPHCVHRSLSVMCRMKIQMAPLFFCWAQGPQGLLGQEQRKRKRVKIEDTG